MDIPSLGSVEHVAVAAKPGVARPFIAGKDDEAAIFGELGGQLVELGPECLGDLEVVALMADRVEECLVAGEEMEVARRVGPDGLLRLTMQVAPIGQQRRVLDNAKRVGGRDRRAAVVDHLDDQVAGRVNR